MKILFTLIALILSFPAWADEHESTTAQERYIESEGIYTPQQQTYVPPAPQPDNRAPVEVLQDCASAGSCEGAFDPYK